MAQKTKHLYQINPAKVDWESESSYLFFNEKLKEKKLWTSYIPILPYLKSHIWLATSGRTQQKWVALSKKALLISAHAVNQHLKVRSKDRWGVCLPLFHVGGLAMTARAHLSQSSCFFYREKWSAQGFVHFLKERKITLCSLVPTQVYDLVQAGLLAPPSLRAVVVGGESLNPVLYQQARALKWPLLTSYGLTECGSQVATAELSSLKNQGAFLPLKIWKNCPSHSALKDQSALPLLKILSHVQVKTIRGEIALKSKSLFTGFVPLFKLKQTLPTSRTRKTRDSTAIFVADHDSVPNHKGISNVHLHKEKAFAVLPNFKRITNLKDKRGWYQTGDKGLIKEGFLQIDKPEHIKILGEKVQLLQLEEILIDSLLKNAFTGRVFLMPLPCDRAGFQLALVTDSFDKKALDQILQQFNQKVAPFEKIKVVYFVPTLPMTGISKLNQPALLKQLGFPDKISV